MAYPSIPPVGGHFEILVDTIRLKHEYGAKGIGEALQKSEDAMTLCMEEIKALPADEEKKAFESGGYEAILALRPKAPAAFGRPFPRAAAISRRALF